MRKRRPRVPRRFTVNRRPGHKRGEPRWCVYDTVGKSIVSEFMASKRDALTVAYLADLVLYLRKAAVR